MLIILIKNLLQKHPKVSRCWSKWCTRFLHVYTVSIFSSNLGITEWYNVIRIKSTDTSISIVGRLLLRHKNFDFQIHLLFHQVLTVISFFVALVLLVLPYWRYCVCLLLLNWLIWWLRVDASWQWCCGHFWLYINKINVLRVFQLCFNSSRIHDGVRKALRTAKRGRMTTSTHVAVNNLS